MSALYETKIFQCINWYRDKYDNMNDKFYHECVAREAEEELAALRSRIAELETDNHRLAQENINLNNNEDFLDDRIAKLEDALQQIKQWGEAYPLEVFPEPDFAKARDLLKAGGQELSAISAYNMRHVVTRVSEIVRKALATSPEEQK